MASRRRGSSIRLQSRVVCPHCWHVYAPEDTLWVSQHSDLMGDPRLGSDHQLRFLPTRFTAEGDAIDSKGASCHGLACPHCHLPVPRAMIETEPLFMSILGAPASGKSYFLTSMTWQLRKTLPRYFAFSFGDAEPAFNHSINEYEERLYLNEDDDQLVALDKTELEGDLYSTVLFGNQHVSYPRPFIFSVKPHEQHPNYKAVLKLSRALCLYDNAGEHFLPGQDTAGSPVTRHLAQSRFLLFLFDPTQDPRFRKACKDRTHDPQMLDKARTSRQESVLLEAADRVRRYTGLAQHRKHNRPLIVVVTKCDAWWSLVRNVELKRPWKKVKGDLCAVDLAQVEQVSAIVRRLLWKLTPELVSAAEGFAEQVIYIPCSAMGRSPEVDPQTGLLGIRPRDVHPVWIEVPLIYSLCRWMEGMIPYIRPKSVGKEATREKQSAPGRDGDHTDAKGLRETGS